MTDMQIAEIVRRIDNLSPGSLARVESTGTCCMIHAELDGLHVGTIDATKSTVEAACRDMPHERIRNIVIDVLYP